MSFLGNLAKGFVRSAVNQVGRDGGKIISNNLYGNSHSIPVRIIGNEKNNLGDIAFVNSETISRKDLASERYQAELLGSGFGSYLLIALGSLILPFIGPIYWIYVAGRNFLKKYTKFYRFSKEQVYVRDRRFKTGKRPEGYKMVKQYSSVFARPTSNERLIYVFKGALALLIAAGISTFQYNWIFSDSKAGTDVVELEQTQFGVVRSEHGLNLRTSASSTGKVLASIPKDASVEIIVPDGREETIGTKTANWMQVKYKDELGWVWAGFIEINTGVDN